MNDNGQYAAAVENCEMAARDNGHALGGWHQVGEQLHASICIVCGAMTVLTRPGYEERWRTGGKALHEGCFVHEEEEDRGLALGA